MVSSAVILGLLFVSVADLPSEKFNLPVQKRTRTCVEMKGEVVMLRFADGTPTGFWAHADDPSKQGSADPCGIGTMEIDAHGALKTANGMFTYYHPGGGPSQYDNYIETGQYGHIAKDDLKGRIKLVPTPNGKRSPVKSARTYYVTPTRIPLDMWYKPNVKNGKSGARYFTYGNPGYDKTYGRGDWSYLNWSWVQNGGPEYPANQGHGGGIARAMLKRGMRLTACDVEPILGVSYGADNKINGRVTAFYAKTHCGPGESGSAIHGWLPHSYQRNDDLIIPCIRRTADVPATTLPLAAWETDESDPMNRMALNLLNELEADEATVQQVLKDWIKKYAAEKDAFARMEILSEMSRLDRTETIELMLKFLAGEEESRVREQAIVLIGYMRSTDKVLEPVCNVMQKVFHESDSERERLRILDIISNFAYPETVKLVGDILPTLDKSVEGVELQIAAADAVLKLSTQTSVDESLVKATLEPLKRHAMDAESRGLRARMIRLLAAPARDQLSFLVGLLETEKSGRVQEIISEVTANLKLGK